MNPNPEPEPLNLQPHSGLSVSRFIPSRPKPVFSEQDSRSEVQEFLVWDFGVEGSVFNGCEGSGVETRRWNTKPKMPKPEPCYSLFM